MQESCRIYMVCGWLYLAKLFSAGNFWRNLAVNTFPPFAAMTGRDDRETMADTLSHFLQLVVAICRVAKSYTHVSRSMAVNSRQARYGIYACMAAMVGAVAYAFVRLYGLNERAGMDIIIVNIVVFTLSAGIMVYLSWKERDIGQEEMFRD